MERARTQASSCSAGRGARGHRRDRLGRGHFYGDEWLAAFESARTGAFRVLQRLRDEGVIRAWGLGVNRVEPLELTLAHPVTRAAVPGSTRPSHVREDVAAMEEKIPAEFWAALREERLVAPAAPVPGG